MFPFEGSILAAAFGLSCLAWGVFELRYNLLRKVAPKARVEGSDRGPILGVLATLGSVLICWLFHWGYSYPLFVGRALMIGGTAAMAGGLVLRYSAAWTLGSYFTREVTLLPGHQIIQKGPFWFLRHPSYLGSILTLAGFAVGFRSLYAIAVTLLAAALVYPARIRAEENALAVEFGERYRAYQRTTKRLLPFVY